MTDPKDRAFVEAAVARIGRGPDKTIPILQAIQSQYRYLPEGVLEEVCAQTDIAPSTLMGVATFYGQFRLTPAGRHLVKVCHGTACHVKGAERVHDALQRALKLEGESDTDGDGVFTIQKVACLGCCTLAPVVQIDNMTFGHMGPEGVPGMLSAFLEQERQKRGLRRGAGKRAPVPGQAEILIGTGSCCVAGGAQAVCEALEEAVERVGADVHLKTVGCVGMCHNTPLVEVRLPNGSRHFYSKVRPEDSLDIVLKHFQPGSLCCRADLGVSRFLDRALLGISPASANPRPLDVASGAARDFVAPQERISTEHSGRLDPLDLDVYLAHEGFRALRTVLGEANPDSVIGLVRESGLRGRGGAGFPTGEKWARVRAQAGGPRYVVMNGDEGDPGAFMDRMILESYPYRVLEGIAIAAYAVEASEGVLYIRAEYPLAVQRMREAIRRCEEQHYLGPGMLGTGFALQLRIMEGAGAFVCGEETALLESIMGRRGMPRLRPPYPAERGLWGRPTLVNNVETLASVPWMVRNGASAFAARGQGKSRGTKVFALAGKVQRGGLIEVPMGIRLRAIVEDMGGGVVEGRTLKAVQIGGPSGGCIPASLLDTPVDYEALSEAGAMMGSGGLVVLDNTDCMVDVARYFLGFTQRESCGKCTFCRVGTRRMLEILDRICEGKGHATDLADLEELAVQVKRASLCGLGQTAPNPVMTTLRYFRDEYEAHLAGRCPAGKCRALIRYVINERCIGCTKCRQVCPADAIPARAYERHEIDPEKCIRCGACRDVCPADAVEVETGKGKR